MDIDDMDDIPQDRAPPVDNEVPGVLHLLAGLDLLHSARSRGNDFVRDAIDIEEHVWPRQLAVLKVDRSAEGRPLPPIVQHVRAGQARGQLLGPASLCAGRKVFPAGPDLPFETSPGRRSALGPSRRRRR
jgi:hypothetical protein